MLDDLESALLQAGAIRIVDDPETPGEQKLERVPVAHDDEEEELVAASAGLNIQQSGAAADGIPDFITSAPGKVILFGEHAVVHGVTAIAGALDLRCYCHVEARSDDKVSLVLPDVGLERTWNLADLPFDSIASERTEEQDDVDADTLPNSHASPDPKLMDIIAGSANLAKSGENMSAKVALSPQAFLYLYMRLAKPGKP